MTTATKEARIDKEVQRRVEEDLTPIDTEESYKDMLNECYSFESVGGIFADMEPARVLEEMDPTAYRCGKNDYEDSLDETCEEINDQYYNREEVQDIRDDIEDEEDGKDEEES